MSRLDGRDVWPGYFPDPVAFYLARRHRPGRLPRWHDDPIRGMHVALAGWAGEPVPKLKHTKRKVRRWQDRAQQALHRTTDTGRETP